MAFPALIRIGGDEKIVIDRPSIMVGRSRKRADFQIDDPTVSSVHCELKADPNGLTVCDLSRHGTLVNGRKVDSARLHEGDIVEISGFRFRVTFDGVAAPVKKTSEKDEWLVRLAGIELGPMPWDELAGMAQRRELQEEDQVRPVSDSEWKSAGRLERLFAVTESEESETAESEPGPAEDGDPPCSPADNEAGDESVAGSRPLTVDSIDENTADPDGAADSVVLNFDEIAEDEVSAVTDEAATQPAFRLDDSDRDPRDPMGDTVLPAQAGTVTEAQVFREAVAAVDALAQEALVEGQSEDVSPVEEAATDSPLAVSIDVENLPQTGWHYRHNGAEFGPVDLDGLSELAEAQLLLPEDSVRIPGSNGWIRSRELPGVFSSEAASSEAARGPVDENSAYEDSSFEDLDHEFGPDRSSNSDQASPALAPFSAAPLLTEPVSRSAGRTSLIEKAAAPVISAGGFVKARPVLSGCVFAAVLAAWLMLPGGDSHEAYVSGQVQLDGAPLKDAAITFTEPNSGWGATAILDENGRFEITTLRGGLRPGRYSVSVMPNGVEPEFVMKELQRQYRQQHNIPDGDEPSVVETGIPGGVGSNKEAGPDESEQPNEKSIALPRGTIPIQYRSAETSGLNAKIEVGRNDVSFNLDSK